MTKCHEDKKNIRQQHHIKQFNLTRDISSGDVIQSQAPIQGYLGSMFSKTSWFHCFLATHQGLKKILISNSINNPGFS